MAEDRHTGRVHVADVPVGTREVGVVASASGRTAPVAVTEQIEVSSGDQTAVLVPVPPRSLGYWVWAAAYTIGVFAVTVANEWW